MSLGHRAPAQTRVVAILFFAASGAYGTFSRSASPRDQAMKMLNQMTLLEKINMLHGTGQVLPYVGNVPANDRLGIPPLSLNDGPQGFRDEKNPGTTTAFPCALAVAATWDTDAIFAYGSAMGKEFADKGANVQLGPGVCVARVPVNGRNFEYVSGEDPYLGWKLAGPLVQGIQSQKVIANAKHWVNNNQETNRYDVNEVVDERTRREMYYPPFEGAIEAGVGSFMCSYNKVNGKWSCENPDTLKDLKQDLGFDGWVMSDWGATHSLSIDAGLDQEMPASIFLNKNTIMQALSNGSLNEAQINDSVVRMLTPMYRIGTFDLTTNASNVAKNVSTAEHVELSRRLASEGTILLKNENDMLPLDQLSGSEKIAVVGTRGDKDAIYHGDGSGRVFSANGSLISPYNGLRWGAPEGVTVDLVNTSDPQEAANALKGKDYDYVVVCVGTSASEGIDRDGLTLNANGATDVDLINAVAGVVDQSKLIVAAVIPGAILTDWDDGVGAVVVNFFPGLQYGNALADVIFGKKEPGGRLPLTFPNRENEVGFSESDFPGINGTAVYSEKMLIGYRWYMHNQVKPKYPFGFGLGYTEHKYSDLQINGNNVTFTLANIGKRLGSEIVQLYVQFPKEANEPPMQLKAFGKYVLDAGESTTVSFNLRDRDLSIWSVADHDWEKLNGEYTIFIAASTQDIRLKGSITVQ